MNRASPYYGIGFLVVGGVSLLMGIASGRKREEAIREIEFRKK